MPYYKGIYDRKDAALALASPEKFHWDEILERTGWFYFTGITPALSESVEQMCLDGCKACRRLGIPVSGELCQYVTVCIANEEDAADVFGIHAEETDLNSGKVNYEGYQAVATALRERFGFQKVAITLRSSLSANDNDWAAMLYDGDAFYYSKTYRMHIVDRVGGGDSFGAGLIYALLSQYDNRFRGCSILPQALY